VFLVQPCSKTQSVRTTLRTFTFHAEVTFRSSLPGAAGPPGEADLLRINPQREIELCACTGWPRLEPGSLNLRVDDSVVEHLGDLCECYFEHPSLIRYPDGKSTIPNRRGGYQYFRGLIRTSELEREEPVLIRRAKGKPLRNLVEAYAPVRLVEVLRLLQGSLVQVMVTDGKNT
jgi:hypothetical protein